MANTHMRVQNVIVYKRYVRDFLFDNTDFTVVYVGGRKEHFKLPLAPTAEEIANYETELEDK